MLGGTLATLLLPALIHPLLILAAAPVVAAYLFFWEIAVVYEDLELREGFKQGHTIMRTYLSEFIVLVTILLIVTGAISIPLNWLAQTQLGYLAAILIWSVVGSTLFLCVLYYYHDLFNRDIPTQPALD